MVAHTCNLSTQEAETGGWQVGDHPRLYSKYKSRQIVIACLKNKKQKQKNEIKLLDLFMVVLLLVFVVVIV